MFHFGIHHLWCNSRKNIKVNSQILQPRCNYFSRISRKLNQSNAIQNLSYANLERIKRIVTIYNRKINPDFKWQSNYHDHIIRDSLAFENIQNKIEKNPLKWKEDKFR